MLTWPLLGTALFIFLARVIDVALGTVRIALVSRGMRRVAPLVGFLEILFWLLAMGQVIQNLKEPMHYIAFAAGFATGTWLGMYIEERLALGLYAVRIITDDDVEELISLLASANIGLTTFAARGIRGQVRLILSVIRRKDLGRVLKTVRQVDPMAFVSVSDVRLAHEGFLWHPPPQWQRMLRWMRKK